MFIEIKSNAINDCYIVAISEAMQCDYKKIENDVTCYEESWGNYLLNNGFELVTIKAIPGKKRITVSELSKTVNLEDIIVCRCGMHAVCIHNNNYYDKTDSGELCVFHYYKKKILV